MKFSVCADLHYDLFQNISMLENDLLSTRAREIDDTFKQIIDSTCSKGIKYLFILGDALHKRNIRSDAINGLLFRRLKYAKEKGLQTYLLVGNHDQAHVAGNVHGFETFTEVVRVVDKPEIITIEGFDFLFLPFEEYKGSKKSLEILLSNCKNPNRVLLAHAGIQGAVLSGFDHQSAEPLTVEDLQLDKFISGYLGHYHMPQDFPEHPLSYIGSPCQHSLQDKVADRGFMIVELKLDGKWRAYNSRITLDTPTFVEMPVEKYLNSPLKGKHYVKITGCSRLQAEMLQSDPNVMSTIGEKAATVVDEEKVIQPELCWSDMIEKFVRISEPNLRKHKRLKKMGKEFLNG